MVDPAHLRSRLLAAWNMTSPDDRDNGRAWYPAGEIDGSIIGQMAGLSVEAGTGILALISPGLSWPRTVSNSTQIVAQWAGHPARPIQAYPAQVDKALRILNGEDPWTVVTGLKVFPFWRGLNGDLQAIPLDRHSFRVAYDWSLSSENAAHGLRSRLLREAVHDAYVLVARELQEWPRDLQAILWLWYRRTQLRRPQLRHPATPGLTMVNS